MTDSACGTFITGQTSYVTQVYQSWRANYVYTNAYGYCVFRPDNGDCVSEGLGYGMILSAAMGDEKTFSGLWSFTQRSQTFNAHGLPSWRMNPDGTAEPDGTLPLDSPRRMKPNKRLFPFNQGRRIGMIGAVPPMQIWTLPWRS